MLSQSPVIAAGAGELTPATVYSPATFVVAPASSGYKADYYTDGTADQTEIQAAVDAAAALTNGGTVLLKAGTYSLSATVTPKSKVRIIGEGTATIVAPTGTTSFSAFTNLASSGSPTTDYEISNMKIDGTNVVTASYSTATKGIFTQYSKRARFDKLYIYNTSATGLGIDYCVDTIITRCIAESCGRQWTIGSGLSGGAGFGIGTGGYADEPTIMSDCIAKNNGAYGIFFEAQSSTISHYAKLANCISYGNSWGIGTRGIGRADIIGCTAYGNSKHGLFNDLSPFATSYSTELNVVGGTFADNTLSGIKFAEVSPSNRHSVIGARIVGNSDVGFIYWGTGNLTVADCQISKNGKDGLRLELNGSDMKDCDVHDNLIFDNSAVSANFDGIRLTMGTANNMDGVNIHDNRCYDTLAASGTQRYGINLASGSGTLTNSNISNNDLRGNKTGAYNTGVTSTTLTLKNNKGYNPVGVSAITVGASPYTYTAGSSPEDVYISGGTVSSVVKGGVTIFALTNTSVHLEPNQAVVVTYAVAPTMDKDVY